MCVCRYKIHSSFLSSVLVHKITLVISKWQRPMPDSGHCVFWSVTFTGVGMGAVSENNSVCFLCVATHSLPVVNDETNTAFLLQTHT